MMIRKLPPESDSREDLRAQLLELYARVISVPAPTDLLVSRFFRLRLKLPAAARGFLAATVYALLRQRIRTLTLHQWAGRTTPRFDWPEPGIIPPGLEPLEEALLALHRWLVEDLHTAPGTALVMSLNALRRCTTRTLPSEEQPLPRLGGSEGTLREFVACHETDRALEHAPADVREQARLSLPRDLIARWTERFGPQDAEKLCLAMGQTASFDVRVNTLRAERGPCAELLAKCGFESVPTKWSPTGLRLERKGNVFRTEPFEQGWFEVQDEASQIVSLALDPKPTWRVLDACSGAGGKALHLSALMKNRGEVFAHDLEDERLEPQKKRLRRAGIHNVRMVAAGTAGEGAPYDAVLIDAPCLGLGTLRRNPTLAWRGGLASRLSEITAMQRDCLHAYAPMVRPGGILVYATCSFEPEETTAMMREFLSRHPEFAPSPLSPPLARQGLERLVTGDAHELLLLPSTHGTDGFYVARLVRR